MNNKLGQEPAFSFPAYTDPMAGQGQDNTHEANNGMSKRFYAACAAMQGLLSNPNNVNIHGINGANDSAIVKLAYSLSDELLKQEND